MDPSIQGKPRLLIRTPEHRLRVFISSTLKELADEREVVRQAIAKLRLVPVMFEAGARPHPAQELYQAYLSESHVFLGIYWQNYGWLGPGMEISGLEDEYNLSASLPRLIYIKGPAPNREEGLTKMLARIQDENTASYKRFTTAAELRNLVENDLALLLTESFESAHTVAPAEFAPRPLTNLPIPRNPILGRGRELATVCEWLSQPDVGMVTLTGTGGTGKSRLALEAALQMRERFADGAYLVRLTPVTEPARVIPVIAETLNLRESAQGLPASELLANFLRERQILLLLDNFEQVLEAAPRVAELMEKCPGVKILVTSRAPLLVRGEKEFQVHPLATPNLRETPTLQSLSQYDSVTLFIQRAQSLKPSFSVTVENAPAIAEICSRLDGLPLAIELAAARIKLLRPQEILARLGQRFDLLRGGTRDLPERQQTLRGAIDWSYNLLSESAQALFRRLSVFNGGWTLDAAEEVCNLDGDLGVTILDGIESLVNFSLLTQTEGFEGQPRFGMLETIREYALERLIENGETDQLHKLHAEYFLRFAREIEPRIRTAERVRWRGVMEQELDNIRAAIDWSNASNESQHINHQLLIVMTAFWLLCGYISEGRRYGLLAEAASDDESLLSAVRAGIKLCHGGFTIIQGEHGLGMPILLDSVRLARQAGDKQLLANCLLWSGSAALSFFSLPLANSNLQEALALFREIGDEWGEAIGLLWFSNTVLLQGDPQSAHKLFSLCLDVAKRQGDPWCFAIPLLSVAQFAFAEGDVEKTQLSLLEAESILRLVGDKWNLAWALSGLGRVALARNDLATARNYFVEGLEIARENGNKVVLGVTFAEMAILLLLEDHEKASAEAQTKAARLCGAAMPYFDFPGPFSGMGYASLIDQARAQIEDSVWEAGVAEGKTMSLDRVVALASQELSSA